MKTYFVVLGRNTALSVSEIYALLTTHNITHSNIRFSSQILTFDTLHTINTKELITKAGGTIKIGQIHTISSKKNLKKDLYNLLTTSTDNTQGEKITFGISAYTLARNPRTNKTQPLKKIKELNILGLALKKQIQKNTNLPIRVVNIQDKKPNLSSVAVEKNKLTTRPNKEIVLIENNSEIYIGTTEAVQPFENYNFRDYKRPVRNMTTGLLPPKLGQILINLSQVSPTQKNLISKKDATLLDPFCGFGTVLQEGYLLGFNKLIGSDIDPKLVNATKRNIAWLRDQQWLTKPNRTKEASFSFIESPAEKLSQKIPAHSINVIATEPFLGPIMTKSATIEKVEETIEHLSELYTKAYKEFHTILNKDGIVSAVWPAWKVQRRKFLLPILEDILALGYENITLPQKLADHHLPERTKRNTILYTREGQQVGREVIVLKKVNKK